jgi:hypothetical protein
MSFVPYLCHVAAKQINIDSTVCNTQYGFLTYPAFHYPSTRYNNPYKRIGGSQPSDRGSIPRSVTINNTMHFNKL